MLYFIADTHFDHANVIEYENRPFSDVIAMNEGLIKNWNSVVKPEDTIYILGDFTLKHNFDAVKGYCDRLNGHKILIRGNHDSLSINKYLAAGFEKICPLEVVENALDGHRLVLSHYPPRPETMQGYNYYLYGHVHGKWCPTEDKENALCVSCERIGYTPISLDGVGEMLRQKRAGTYKKVQKPSYVTDKTVMIGIYE